YQSWADCTRHFSDPRYIRAGGRPLLLIYRPGIIPNTRETVERWRLRLKNDFGHDAWFLMSQSFGDTDPRECGFDRAFEFTQHKFTQALPLSNSRFNMLDAKFSGQVFTYDEVI